MCFKHCPPLSFRWGENLPTLNCSSVMQAKYVWGAVWGQKSDKNSLRGNLSFAFAQTSALPGSRPNKETLKKARLRKYNAGSFEALKDSFLAVSDGQQKEFLVMIIRGSIETLPIEVLEEVTTTCIEESLKIWKFRLLQVFSYLGDPDVVSVASVCLQWAGQ